MAVGVRKNGKGYRWECCVAGKRLSGTESTEKKAIQAREQAITATRALNVAEAQNKEHVETTVQPDKTCPTLQEAIDDMMLAEWNNCKSQDSLQSNLKFLLKYFGGDIRLNQITTKQISAYIAYCRQRGVSNATLNRKISPLSKLLKKAAQHEQIAKCPFIEHQKETGHRIRYITEDEEQAILAWCVKQDYTRLYCMIVVLIDTGIRCGELLKLRSTDVIMEQGRHGIIRLNNTKNGRDRSVPLTQRAAEALRTLQTTSEDREYIVSEKYYEIRALWLEMREQLGYKDDKWFILHILRHTCCSRLVAKGAPIKKVQMWMGHLNILTTMRYTHLAPEELYDMTALLEA